MSDKLILRPIHVLVDVNSCALGSNMYCAGKTKILSTMTMSDHVPRFMKDTPGGWLTAEYSMLPAATQTRSERDYKKPFGNGRVMEIQRLIGRSLRTCVDLKKMPNKKTITIDCDVVQADGSTRTNSINAGMISLIKGIQSLQYQRLLQEDPLTHMIAAVSVGMHNGEIHVDLDYNIDSNADCDINVVMNEHGDIIEIQGSSEKKPIKRTDMDRMLEVAWSSMQEVFKTIKLTTGYAADIE